MRFGYRLMRGRQGVGGHARAMGERTALSVRGLAPGEQCALCAMSDKGGRVLEERRADQEGRAQFITDAEEGLFVTAEGRVVLWEDGPEAERQYLLACAWLGREKKQTMKTAEDAADKPGESTGQEAGPAVPRTGETPPAHPGDRAVQEREDDGRKMPLRQAGDGEAVDALPILRWPAGTEDLRLNCTLRPPFAPFYAPGWRFVQVPSPLPQAPFCAVGYRARDARVTDIAYAIPGSPAHPPVALAGYHYRPGYSGRGYWVMTRPAENSKLRVES